jgi:RHS repeat-associated protein
VQKDHPLRALRAIADAATTDGNGNLLSDPSIPGNTYTWNERNQLATATAGGVQSSYVYDALGRRVGQTISGLTAQYVYDMLNVAEEQYTGGSVADMLPGLGLDENFARTDTSGSYAMLPDLLGSTVGLVNSTGALGTQYQYGPFGQTTTSGASSTNPFQYTGREMDPTGLYFLRARYYNPIAQRFISPDPIGLLGGQVNFYAYAGNSPMNFVDRTGLQGAGIGYDYASGTWLLSDGSTITTGGSGTGDTMGGYGSYLGTGVWGIDDGMVGGAPTGGVEFSDVNAALAAGSIQGGPITLEKAVRFVTLLTYNMGSDAFEGAFIGAELGALVGQPELGIGVGVLAGMAYGAYETIGAIDSNGNVRAPQLG